MHRPLVHRLLAGLLLAWLGLLQFPLPAPVHAPGGGKDLSLPFPCMNRPCGCASAEQCWTSCCCTTKAERIAWAQENLGYIPEALATANEDATCRHAHSCCAPKEQPRPQSRAVVLGEVLKCRGKPAGWSIFSAAVPVTDPQTPVVAPVLVGRAVLQVVTFSESLAIDPPTPPPRSRFRVSFA